MRLSRHFKRLMASLQRMQCPRMSSASDGSSLISEPEKKTTVRWPRFYFLGIAIFFLYGISIWVLLKFAHYSSLTQRGRELSYFDGRDLLDEVNLDCVGLLRSEASAIKDMKSWKFDINPVEEAILEADDKCAAFKQLFSFRDKPLSQEEADYPLAYGMVVYKQITQVLFMISSFYHPQNEYCIAVSGSAKPHFKVVLRQIASCFPNIHIMQRPPIAWGSFEIINSTYRCLEYLTTLDNKWEYFQYLSGVDIPLKTNLEMVKMLKEFNGTVNVEFKEYQHERAKSKNISDSPLPLYKSSLSAVIPRSTANVMATSNVTQELLDFLKFTAIPDEAFWATLTGNFEEFPIPGGFNAQEILDFRETMDSGKRSSYKNGYAFNATRWGYYMSRYQLWGNNGCGGKMSSGSCIFGVKDLGTVMKQPHLVAHKFYIDFEPAAYFCALKEIRRRSKNPGNFNAAFYQKLPQLELRRGVPFENLTHPMWIV